MLKINGNKKFLKEVTFKRWFKKFKWKFEDESLNENHNCNDPHFYTKEGQEIYYSSEITNEEWDQEKYEMEKLQTATRIKYITYENMNNRFGKKYKEGLIIGFKDLRERIMKFEPARGYMESRFTYRTKNTIRFYKVLTRWNSIVLVPEEDLKDQLENKNKPIKKPCPTCWENMNTLSDIAGIINFKPGEPFKDMIEIIRKLKDE